MAKHILVVISNPTPGHESEYNRWYSEQHLDDVLRVPGFVAAQRFKLTTEMAKNIPGSYLAIYEVEAEDYATALAGLTEAASSGAMVMSPAIDAANVVSSLFTPITSRKIKK